MNGVNLEVFFHANWGNEKGEIEPVISKERALSSFSSNKVDYDYIKPFIFNLSSDGNTGIVASQNKEIYIFNVNKQFTSKYEFDPILVGELVDVLFEHDNFFVLMLIQDNLYSLLKLDKNRTIKWQVNIPDNVCKELGYDGSGRIYIMGEKEELGNIQVLDSETGIIYNTIKSKYHTKKASIINDKLYLANYFPEKEKRGVELIKLGSGSVQKFIMDSANSIKLLYPLGITSNNDVITFVPRSYETPGIYKFTLDNEPKGNVKFTDIDVNDDIVYFLYSHNKQLNLTSINVATGETEKLDLSGISENFEDENIVIHDIKENNHLILNATIDLEDKFYDLNLENLQLTEIKQLENNYRKSLQAYDTWELDSNGNIYIPIIKPDGFYILKLLLN